MTVLYLDGFDVGDFAERWFIDLHGSNVPLTDATVVPFPAATHPGLSLHINNDTEAVAGVMYTYLKRAFASSSGVQIGFQFRYSGSHSGADIAVCSLFGDANSTPEAVLYLRTDGTFYAKGNGTTIGTGPAGAVHADTWYFVEIQAGAAGTFELRVNEAVKFSGSWSSTISNFDALALNRTTSNPSGNAQPDLYYDDVRIDSGSTYFGMGRVQTLLPGAAGTYTQLAVTGAASNYDAVNDVPWSASDYVSSSTPGQRDTYQLDNLDAATASVAAIQTVIIGASTDATAHIKAALRSGGSLYYDPSVALNATPTVASIAVRETDPATSSAWSVSGVNALEAGVEIQ